MSSETKYWHLHNHGLFSQLTENNIKELSVISGFIKAQRKDLIQFSNKNEKRLYILKQGIIEIIQIDNSGKEVVIDTLENGDFFGESMNDQIDFSKQFAKAMTDDVIICSFTTDDFIKVLEKNPSISLKLVQRLQGKIFNLQTKYSDLIFKDVKTRLIEFLIRFSKSHGEERSDNSQFVKKNLTHEAIAQMIGCKRQTVSTLMQELVLENKISYSRTHLIVNSAILKTDRNSIFC